MAPDIVPACPPEFSADASPPDSTPATPPMPRKRLANTGGVRSAGAATKATSKSSTAGKPPLAPVLSGPHPRKPTEAMQALSQAVEDKKKRKAAAALGSTPTRKAKPSSTSSTPTPSSAAVAAGADRPRVAARDVIDEMPESQASATEIGVAKFLSHLDSSHTQGLDDLHFAEGLTTYAEEDGAAEVVAKEEEAEEDELDEVVTEVAAPKDKVKAKSKRSLTNRTSIEDTKERISKEKEDEIEHLKDLLEKTEEEINAMKPRIEHLKEREDFNHTRDVLKEAEAMN